jgi:segregation and condensation protein A
LEKFKLNLQLLDKKFEDSLDLLLELIKINQVNIFDIPVAEITRQYIDYIDHFKEIDPDYASEFIVMASTLLYIKSRMMLPTESEFLEDDFDDPRHEIVQQLIEYQKFKQAADALENLEESFAVQREDSQLILDIKSEEQWKEVSVDDLLKAFKKIIARPKSDFIFKRPKVTFTVSDKMEEILQKLEDEKSFSFNTYFENYIWVELIVSFIAILELVRLQSAVLKQHTVFDEIWIFKKEINLMKED